MTEEEVNSQRYKRLGGINHRKPRPLASKIFRGLISQSRIAQIWGSTVLLRSRQHPQRQFNASS
jgi:hypothetical protein